MPIEGQFLGDRVVATMEHLNEHRNAGGLGGYLYMYWSRGRKKMRSSGL